MTRVFRTVTCGGSSEVSSAEIGWLTEEVEGFGLRKKKLKRVIAGFWEKKTPQGLGASVVAYLWKIGCEIYLIANGKIKYVIWTHRHCRYGTTFERIVFARIPGD